MTRVELELPPLPEYVGTARMVVSSVARQHEFPDEQVQDLKVAVSEAVTNAIRAHRSAQIEARIVVTVHLDPERLVLEVLDEGAGFEPADLNDLERTPAPGDLEGGLGLSLVRALFSETTIERRPERGMCLRIVAKRGAESA